MSAAASTTLRAVPASDDVGALMRDIGARARASARQLALAPPEVKRAGLKAAADAIRRAAPAILAANAEDVAQDQVDAEVKIACPVLSLWGADFEAVGKMFDMAAIWSEMAENLRAEAIDQCGHLPQEEQPGRVNGLLLEFLEGWNG